MKFLIRYLSSSSCHIIYILTKYIHQRLTIEFPPSLMFFLHETETPCFIPMRNSGTNYANFYTYEPSRFLKTSGIHIYRISQCSQPL
jgi:hypothetical protein